ncbi:MAG TPA: hypothetical protein DDZ89_18425 [Clostridiales bacterium]|nr:hypothetical protein [Clostridiales bacterium]
MNSKTKKIAMGGILTALTVLAVFSASFAPSGKISIYVLASFFTAISIIHSDIKFGLLFYITTSVLSWIVLPNKMAVVPYIGFFGWYGIVKALIEKLNRRSLEWIIKIIIMNLVMVAAFFFFQSFLPEIDLSKPWIWPVILVLLQVIYVIYDYVFTLIIDYYYRRFYNKFKN